MAEPDLPEAVLPDRSGPGPDFVKLAEAYGIQGERAATQPEFEAAFRRAVAAGRPYLIECAIDKDAMVHPMVPGGAPVTDFLLD